MQENIAAPADRKERFRILSFCTLRIPDQTHPIPLNSKGQFSQQPKNTKELTHKTFHALDEEAQQSTAPNATLQGGQK